MATQEYQVPAGQQQPTHDGFVAVDQWYDCAQCVAKHGERFEFPPLDPEHYDAWSIFQAVGDQVRVGMDVVGLDYAVLPAVFDLYAVPQMERRYLFERIAILNHVQQEHRAIERARKESMKAAEQHNKVAHGR